MAPALERRFFVGQQTTGASVYIPIVIAFAVLAFATSALVRIMRARRQARFAGGVVPASSILEQQQIMQQIHQQQLMSQAAAQQAAAQGYAPDVPYAPPPVADPHGAPQYAPPSAPPPAYTPPVK